ncbi:conjugal transfer protein [Streptomyces sp. NBC_00162]|uniref:conjugal transfer protein n=1 Tax=Streptomyces sp. NBC_00162 TaxID=2903629 RepID=UPI00214B4244|nr:conjugal transfer protein [Streptomyces sp. NBC_00162]UUU37537.1 conjugal transfer protein [Streptomyces sp. NBC_00162]
MVRVGIWTALAAGPLALAVAFAVPRTTIAQAAPAPRATDTARTAADPAGVAEMFVDLWLRADGAQPDSAVAIAVRSLAPGVELPKRPRAATVSVAARTVAVRSAVLREGMWTVVVGAIADRGEIEGAPSSPSTGVAGPVLPVVRYFAVSVAGDGSDKGRFTVVGAPAEVAVPDAAAVAESEFSVPVPSTGVLATSMGEFVRAYLSGGQGASLERYLSPGVRVSAPRAASYARVDVEDVAADAEAALGATVPADGAKARVRVRVRVMGEDRAGVRWPLVYRLEVTARAGRWEVSALEAATTSPPAAAPSPAASVSGGAR